MKWVSTARVLARQVPKRMQSTVALEETDLAQMRDAVKQLSFVNPQKLENLSPEHRQQLTAEFDKFLNDFVDQVDSNLPVAESIAEKVSGIDPTAFTSGSRSYADQNLSGRSRFPSVATTEPDQPYSEAELYVRQLFHAKRLWGLGADVTEVYKPHENLNRPKSISDTGISSLLASGAHLGHATSRVRASCLPYVYGIREGIHIIDLQQTLAALRRASHVLEQISLRGGVILYVGTRDGQRRTVERAAQRSNGHYVYDRWIPGTFTNYQIMIEQKQKALRHEVDLGDRPTGRQLSPSLNDTIIKPDMVVVLNPVENRALLAECAKLRIPTTGIVDTDSEPSLLTYPIPGNDDSLRFTDLVAGVLSRAAQSGRKKRLTEFNEFQTAKSRLREGEAFVASEKNTFLSEKEMEMLDESK